jgi:hypothetical protein
MTKLSKKRETAEPEAETTGKEGRKGKIKHILGFFHNGVGSSPIPPGP